MSDKEPFDTGEDPGRRSNPRAPLGIPGRLILRDGKCACSVENISRKGACIATEVELKVGDHGMLQRAGLDHFFTVEWVNDGRCGLSFDVVVPKQVIMAMRRIAENAEESPDELLRAFGRDWASGAAGHSRDT